MHLDYFAVIIGTMTDTIRAGILTFILVLKLSLVVMNSIILDIFMVN